MIRWNEFSKIISLYLYGTETPPSNYEDRLLSDGQSRPTAVVDAFSYMQEGSGRYAYASNAQVVQDFFDESKTFPVGEWNKDQMQEILGYPSVDHQFDDWHFAITQSEIGSDSSDYGIRSLIYNSTRFFLSEEATFVVNEDGSKYIKNMAIYPEGDDFNFIGGSWGAYLGNFYLENEIDPYNIGETVYITFSGDVPMESVYTYEDYQQDKQNKISNYTGIASHLKSDIDVLLNILKSNKTIDYVTDDGGKIVYDGGITGNLEGTAFSDILVGGNGEDILDGGRKNDILFGGYGYDTYRFNGNFGVDVISDSDSSGKIVVNGVTLSGLATFVRETSSGNKIYELNGYRLVTSSSNNNILIEADNSNYAHKNKIIVKNFSDGHLGIVLENYEPGPGSDESDADPLNDIKDFEDYFKKKLTDPDGDGNNTAGNVDTPLDLGLQHFGAAVADSVPKDPLIVDLNGDGLQLSSWQNSNVRFDMSGDGVAERTGWTVPSADDVVYNSGSGNMIIDRDVINLVDQIELGDGIVKEDLIFSRETVWRNSEVDYDLVISFADAPGDRITIINYFRNPKYEWNDGVGTPVQIDPYKIKGVKFADGSDFDFFDLKFKVEGTDGNETLVAENVGIDHSPETFIDAGSGDDTIYGSDLVSNAGSGDDYFQISGSFKVSGGDGDDTIRSSDAEGNNEVFGGDGNDYIRLKGGSNFVNSGRGNDTISLSDSGDSTVSGDHIVFSGSGADNITTQGGDDVINAGSGDDTISAGLGDNMITGGLGADFFNIYAYDSSFSAQSSDVITDFDLDSGDKINLGLYGGESFDDLTIYQEGSDAVIEIYNKKITLQNIDSVNITKDYFQDFEDSGDTYGGALDDTLNNHFGGSGIIYGGGGDDNISVSSFSMWGPVDARAYGEEGDDTLSSYDSALLDGGSGDDILQASGSGSTLIGGSGNDSFVFGGGYTQNNINVIEDFDVDAVGEKIILQAVNNASFDDLVITDSDAGAVVTYNLLDSSGEESVEQIILNGILASQLNASHFDIRQKIWGSLGDDNIILNDGKSYYIEGNGGNDTIVTSGGDDNISSSAVGDKNISSGAGNDEINIRYGSANIDAGLGDDFIYYESSNIEEGKGFEILGGAGNDYIHTYTSSSYSANDDRKIWGEEGDDTININWGSELDISGGAGNDTISGSAQDSTISGGEGNDIITLSSHANSNNEVFAGSGNDIISLGRGTRYNNISGGEGDDLFVIRERGYNDLLDNIIVDFEVGNLNEKIDLQFRDIERFEDLAISQNGADTIITFNESENITLQNVDSTLLSADNFIFKNVGSDGNDLIDANHHVNKVEAGVGNDIITISGQDNEIYGGSGNDIFVVEKNANSTTIIHDFLTLGSYEKIQLKGFGDISFDDVLINYWTTTSDDDTRKYNANISLGDGQMLEVKNIPSTFLSADDFLFTDLTAEELEEFNNSLEPNSEDSTIDVIEEIADIESANKIYSSTQNTTFINVVEGAQPDVSGTGISISPQINDDVFLVLDKNNNGEVDDVSELFGNDENAGFEELSLYDSNADLVIDSQDSQYDLLKFWNDTNANAVVDEGELTTLAENGVQEISLRTINSGTTLEGNFINRTAEIKFDNGNVGVVNEVFFGVSNFDSALSDPDEALGPNFALSFDALNLPFSRGFGGLHSWQVAMSLDSELLDIAQSLNDLEPNELYKIDSLFESFLYKWADIDDSGSGATYTSSNGDEISVSQIDFLEKLTGFNFVSATNSAVSQSKQAWDLFYNAFLARFLTQGTFKEIFPDAHYDLTTDITSLNITLDGAISNILSTAVELDSNNFLTYVHYAKKILQLNRGQFDDSNFDSKVESMVENVVDSVVIDGFDFDGVLNIASGDNTDLYGSGGSDIMKGSINADNIYADSGDDYIEGGQGSDYLRGEAGNDIYKFSVGDGQNIIEESSGNDKIILGEGIAKSSLNFAQVGDDLIINFGDLGDKIGIKNFYSSNNNRVEKIEFFDGEVFDLANIGDIIDGSPLDDHIMGTTNDDIINAGDGNDIIEAGSGNDTVNAGKGNDIITDTSGGDDSYIFKIGDGADIIQDFSGNDVIIFGEGITQENITLIPDVANDDSLIIKIGETGDQITLKEFFSNAGTYSKIEKLQFFDGSEMDLSNGLEINGTNIAGEELKGTVSDDVINGNIGNDIINANAGNDVVTAGQGDDIITDVNGGNDTYMFNVGDGSDTIKDFSGSDVIIFGAGITQGDITLIPDVVNDDTLIIKIGDDGDQIRLLEFFASEDNYRKIETLQFSDGSTMNLGNGLEINATNVGGEELKGTAYSDVITGNIGDDNINAGGGDDMVEGGQGNDVIIDNSSSNDTYIFNIGDGMDVIEDYNGDDVISFGEGITQDDITLISDVANNESLIVKVGDNGDQINLKYFFSYFSGVRKIETLSFVDGSTMDLSSGLELNATNISGEELIGTSYDDVITGNIGDDNINSGAGNDVVQGGQGNDILIDIAGGDDIYLFNVGDGVDVIEDYSGNDVIRFGEGISKDDIELVPDVANDDSLIIKIGDNGDQIKLKEYFSNRVVETLEFFDGSVMDLSNGLEITGTNIAGEVLKGTSFDDVITGNIGDDDIRAGDGDDIVQGGKGNDVFFDNYSGNDTYIFNSGDGADIIEDYNGSDIISFGEGIVQGDITLIPDVANNDSLIIKVGDDGDQITLTKFFSSYDNYRKIETLQFFDGSVIDLSNGIEINGGNSDGETLKGTNFTDVITGNDGDDTILSGAGDDVINGAKGNDYVTETSGGNDTYIFNIGDGADVIRDSIGDDVIVFGDGIGVEDIQMQSMGNDLVINVGDLGDQITLDNFFNGYKIENLEFADGNIVRIDEGIDIIGSDLNDKIIGTPFDDILQGGAGSDYIYAGDGDDLLNGGSDNDDLRGGQGSDQYVFASNDGYDIIREEGGLEDTIYFGADVDSSKMAAMRNGNDLVLSQQGIGDIINISNFFTADSNRVEYVEFDNGLTFNLVDIVSSSADTSYSFNGYAKAKEDVASVIKLLDPQDSSTSYLNITAFTQATNGVVSRNSDGDLVYTSETNFNGSDSFEVSYVDAEGNAQSTVINLDVLAVNDAPVASDFTIETNEDNAVEIDVLASATDIDVGDSLIISSLANPTHGFVRIEDNKIIYTPKPNFNGVDSFEYTISDGNGGFDTKEVSLNVSAVNDVPVANDDNFVVNENQSISMDVTGNDHDVETGFFDGSSITIISAPANGQIEVQANGKIHYTPNADYYGSDSFSYTISDTDGEVSNVATVSIGVDRVNSAPKPIDNKVMSVDEDTTQIFDIADYFYDREGDAMELVSAYSSNASIEINGNKISYLANENFSGSDFMTITIRDANGASASIVSEVVVNAVNDAPEAQDDHFSLLEDGSVNLTILNNDYDVEDVLFASNISNITSPLHGSVTINESDGSLFYSPNANYHGLDSFSYSITDSGGLTSTATVNLTIESINDIPVASDDEASIDEDSYVDIDVISNDSDIDHDSLSVLSIDDSATIGRVSMNDDGSIKYHSDGKFNHLKSGEIVIDSFIYVISDSKGGTSSARVNVTITGTNDAPIISGAIPSINSVENQLFSYAIPSDIFSDVDGDDLTLSVSLENGLALPTWLSFDSTTNILSGTPVDVIDDFALSLKVTATDPSHESISQNFTLNIENLVPTDQVILGSNGSDIIIGADGNDELKGRSGDDILRGNEGDDVLKGNKGDDILNGGIGNDILLGGLGSDTLRGGDGDDTMSGNGGDDDLRGQGGDDVLKGGLGNDFLKGGSGNDSLMGHGDDDTLMGNWGSDFLSGGQGRDIFVFNKISDSVKGRYDHIHDFEQGIDLIDLSNLGFSDISKDNSVNDDSVLTYSHDGNKTIIEGEDQNFKIELRGIFDLGASDFDFG